MGGKESGVGLTCEVYRERITNRLPGQVATDDLVDHWDKCLDCREWHRGKPQEKPAQWFTPADLPTEPGLYYWERPDKWGNPMPGMFLWAKDQPMRPPCDAPWKIFGPIRGAMQPWPEFTIHRVSKEAINEMAKAFEEPKQ